MNDAQKVKIQRFVEDSVMSGAVYDVLLQTFIKQKPRGEVTVHELAAERIAINLLNEAFKELEKFKADEQNKSGPSGKQVGL